MPDDIVYDPRAVRRAWFEDLVNSNEGKPELVFSRGNDRKENGDLINSISVNLWGQWPKENRRTLPISLLFNNEAKYDDASLKMWLIGSQIRSIAGFIEGMLDTEVKVHEITKGRITVKYHIPDFVEPWEIQSVVRHLNYSANGNPFCIYLAWGHAEGKKIEAGQVAAYQP